MHGPENVKFFNLLDFLKFRDFFSFYFILFYFWGRPRRRWEDNIKIDLQEVGGACGD